MKRTMAEKNWESTPRRLVTQPQPSLFDLPKWHVWQFPQVLEVLFTMEVWPPRAVHPLIVVSGGRHGCASLAGYFAACWGDCGLARCAPTHCRSKKLVRMAKGTRRTPTIEDVNSWGHTPGTLFSVSLWFPCGFPMFPFRMW